METGRMLCEPTTCDFLGSGGRIRSVVVSGVVAAALAQPLLAPVTFRLRFPSLQLFQLERDVVCVFDATRRSGRDPPAPGEYPR